MNTSDTNTSTSETEYRPRWMRLLGLRRREGRWLRVKPTRWGLTLIALVVFLGGGAAFTEYSMQPDFCRSCHIMEPYYQAWHGSTHNEVPCGDCHFEPGLRNTVRGKFEASSQAVKFITGTYGSKPHAEVRDASCLREGCHERRLLEGNVTWDVPSQRGETVTIRFDHTPHLDQMRRGKQLRCVSCHSQIVQGQHLVVTLDTCFLCHFKGFEHGRKEETLGGCDSCHAAPQEQIRLSTGMFDHSEYVERDVECSNCHSDALKGDGSVPRQFCWNCHNRPSDLARYGDTSFIHRTHVTDHKVECSSCHVQIEHHLTAGLPADVSLTDSRLMLDNSGNCGQCHDSMHNAALDIYRGIGARGVPEMPSPMFRAQVDCIACHKTPGRDQATAHFAGQTYTTGQVSCDHCHGNRYENTLEDWRQSIEARLVEAETAYRDAQAIVNSANLTGAERLEAMRLIDDANHNIRMVKHGHGEHNVPYATAALSVAIESCQEAAKIAQGVTTARRPHP